MLSDLRFAFRSLCKAPIVTLVATITLALGIGAATTSFSVLNAILLKPLPFIQHQERMLYLNEAVPSKGIDSTDICYADFLDWRSQTKTVEALWVYDNRTVILAGKDGSPERFAGSGVSEGAFAAMGVQPALGRDFRAEDYLPGATPVALLGEGVWQRRFGGEADVIGRVVTINGLHTTIIGVMPRGWRYPETQDIWVPLKKSPAEVARGHFDYSGHAMLKPGVSLDEARAEFATISAALAHAYPKTNSGLVAVLRPVREEATEDTAEGIKLLFGAVLFVFLIACANVASLLLARVSTRSREIAVRLTLGASRWQLLRQFMLESVLLGLLGGLGGLLVSLWCLDLIVAAIPVELPFWMHFSFDARVFGFTSGLTLLGSMIFGLAPAWQASRPQLVEELKDGGRSATAGARSHRLRSIIVATEIALALILLVAAGLSLRSFFTLHRVAPGFDPRNVLTFRVGFPAAMVDQNPNAPEKFYQPLLTRLGEIPGVEKAAAISALPGLGIGDYTEALVEGQPVPANFAEIPQSLSRIATPGYFETLRIPLRAGRTFTARDDADHPRVVVVDENFVARFFPNTDPIGKRFRTHSKDGQEAPWHEIVGVVGSTRRWFDRSEPVPTYYVPQLQEKPNFMTVVMRVQGDPATYAEAARLAVLAVNPDLPIYNVIPHDRAIAQSDSMWKRRFFGSLFTGFALLALALSSIGIYGVMAYSVMQRTQEIGVRMALGAQTGDILRMVLRGGFTVVGSGLLAGFIGAWFVTQLLTSMLYGISPHDPPTFAAVPALLALVALAACILPALRAARVDPIVALRAD